MEITINATTTKITTEITINANNITSDNPGDWMELLFVGAGRLSDVGGGGAADDEGGGGGGGIMDEIE